MLAPKVGSNLSCRHLVSKRTQVMQLPFPPSSSSCRITLMQMPPVFGLKTIIDQRMTDLLSGPVVERKISHYFAPFRLRAAAVKTLSSSRRG